MSPAATLTAGHLPARVRFVDGTERVVGSVTGSVNYCKTDKIGVKDQLKMLIY